MAAAAAVEVAETVAAETAVATVLVAGLTGFHRFQSSFQQETARWVAGYRRWNHSEAVLGSAAAAEKEVAEAAAMSAVPVEEAPPVVVEMDAVAVAAVQNLTGLFLKKELCPQHQRVVRT